MPIAHPFRPRRSSTRRGRALVELLVSTLLLTAGTSVVLALMQGSMTAADQLSQLHLARSLARDQAEALVLDACASVDGRASRGRTEGRWRTTTTGSLVVQELELRRPRSPGATQRPRPLEARAAGWCP